MYSLVGRINYITYNVMTALLIVGALNHISERYGHVIGTRDTPIGLKAEDITFEFREVHQFLSDRYYKEEALDFTFDLKVDLEPIMTWNTHTIFATLVAVYETENSKENSVTVWDQRIPRTDKDNWKIDLKNEHVEYYLTDINKQLKGTNIKIFFKGEIMSTIGSYYGEAIEVGEFRTPTKYMGSSKRAFKPGPLDRVENY